jgi:hypothetical protein
MAEDVKAEPGAVVDLTEGGEPVGTAPALSRQTDRALGWRWVFAVALAVLAMIGIVLSIQALWVNTTLGDEDRFVSTFEPLAGDEAVATAVSVRVADGVVSSEEYQSFVGDALPSELGVLAVPITGAVREIVATASGEVVQSDVFAEAWSAALRTTHVAVSAVLTGNDAALESEGGVVSLNLDELAATVIERIESSRGIDLPEIESDLGSIVILESDQLASAQTVVEGINRAAWVFPIVALLLIVAAMFAAPDKPLMVLILVFGTAFVGLLNLVFLRFAQSRLVENAANEVTRDAVDAVYDIAVAGLRAATWALIVLALLIGFFAWLNGSSAWGRSLKASTIDTVEGWKREPEAEPSGFARFLAGWKRPIQLVVILFGFAYILFGPPPSGVSVFLTAVVVVGVAVLVEVLAGAAEPQKARTQGS